MDLLNNGLVDFLRNIPGVEGILGFSLGILSYNYGKSLVKTALSKVVNLFLNSHLDASVKILIIAKISQVQERLKTAEGKKKMQAVISFAKDIIPGKLDDIVIEKICQACYDEFIKFKLD